MPDAPQLGIASKHATARIPIAQAQQTAAVVREELTGRSFDYAGDVAVLANSTLVGLLAIERLLADERGSASRT